MSIQIQRLLLPTAMVLVCMAWGQVHAESLAIRVAATADDAEENIGPGSMEALDSSDLELGVESVPGGAEGIQLAGMRFLGVEIPPGSIINSASIQFTVDEDDKGPAEANFGIFGELSPNAAAFTSAANNISGRDGTSNVVAWLDVPSWTGQVGMAGADQRTPDISSIVQEIIDQPDWAMGNAMAFGIAPIDPATGDFDVSSEANRTAESFDGVAASAPLLQVDFAVPEPSSVVLIAFGLVVMAGTRRRR